MRIPILAIALAAGAACSASDKSPTGAYPSGAIVYALASSFSPVESDITLGGTVQFVFPSTAHNVIFNAANGAPADIPGEVTSQTVSRTFSVRGSFIYNCTIHPGMTGTIVVH